MNEKDEEFFEQERQRLQARVRKAMREHSDDLADAQADLMEHNYEERCARDWDAIEDGE